MHVRHIASNQAKELHTKALDMALTHYGKDHATATLARGNLVETLDTLGETEAARQLLVEYIDDLLKMAEEKEAEAPEEQQVRGVSSAYVCVRMWPLWFDKEQQQLNEWKEPS